MKAYDELRMEMIPYAPGFAPWGGCRLCARQETGNEDCEAWRLVRRFWGLLGRDGQGIDGKLRFSDPHASRRGKPKGVSVAVHIRFPSQCPKDIDKDKDKDIIELGPYVR
jgi:hypothetical protein